MAQHMSTSIIDLQASKTEPLTSRHDSGATLNHYKNRISHMGKKQLWSFCNHPPGKIKKFNHLLPRYSTVPIQHKTADSRQLCNGCEQWGGKGVHACYIFCCPSLGKKNLVWTVTVCYCHHKTPHSVFCSKANEQTDEINNSEWNLSPTSLCVVLVSLSASRQYTSGWMCSLKKLLFLLLLEETASE